jgi:hypothetical protein
MTPSPLPELDVARIRRYVDDRNERVPPEARDKIRYEMDLAPSSITIVECRPPWREGFGSEWTRFPIARFRYVKTRKKWSLYWRDRNLKFHLYDRVPATTSVQDLLDEVSADPTYIFWG